MQADGLYFGLRDANAGLCLFHNRVRRFMRIFHEYYSNGQGNKAALSTVAVTPNATPSGSTAHPFVPTHVTLIFSMRHL